MRAEWHDASTTQATLRLRSFLGPLLHLLASDPKTHGRHTSNLQLQNRNTLDVTLGVAYIQFSWLCGEIPKRLIPKSQGKKGLWDPGRRLWQSYPGPKP